MYQNDFHRQMHEFSFGGGGKVANCKKTPFCLSSLRRMVYSMWIESLFNINSQCSNGRKIVRQEGGPIFLSSSSFNISPKGKLSSFFLSFFAFSFLLFVRNAILECPHDMFNEFLVLYYTMLVCTTSKTIFKLSLILKTKYLLTIQ